MMDWRMKLRKRKEPKIICKVLAWPTGMEKTERWAI